MSIAIQELRQALRRLRRSPGFTVASILTLGLGIGATAAVYSVVHSTVIRPLPYPDSDRIIWLDHAAPGLGTERGLGMTDGLYAHYREGASKLEDFAIWLPADVTLAGETPERLRAVVTTPSLFTAIRVPPALGAAFTADQVASGQDGMIVISHALWQRRFGGDRDVVGRVVRVNGNPLEVVGVMPRGFEFPDPEADVWAPLSGAASATRFGGFNRQGIARLAPGATRESAEADLRSLIPGLRERFGVGRMLDDTGLTPTLPTLKEQVVRDAERTLWILFGSVAFVLLLACANVANLFLVRAESRQSETAVRRALGAGPSEIARYFLAEGALLSVAGGVVGMLSAWFAVRILLGVGPEHLPRLSEIAIRPAVLVVAFGIALSTSLLFALLPALRRDSALAETLKTGGRGPASDRSGSRARGALMATQVALALVLLVATGLMTRSFVHLVRFDLGFRAEKAITFQVGLTRASHADSRSAVAFHRDALERLRALPGVEAAAATTCLPLCDRWSGTQLVVEGRPDDPGSVPRVVALRRASEDFFETMQIPLLAGRLPTRLDLTSESGAAVISRELAAAYWRDADPLGQRFRSGTARDVWYTVVGIVENTPINGVAEEPPPIAYLPLVQASDTEVSPYELSYVLRTAVAPVSVLASAREVIRELDPAVPVSRAATLEQIVAQSNVQTAFTTVVLAIAAGIALLLGVVGIYGVISYAVGRRVREIGIRMALGARSGQVSGTVLWQGGKVIVIGLLTGLAAAFAATRLMRDLLFGVSPTDVWSFAGGATALLAVALLATYLPARRAARVDPAETLRAD